MTNSELREKKRVINYNKRKIREINKMIKNKTLSPRKAALLKKKHLLNIYNERQYELF